MNPAWIVSQRHESRSLVDFVGENGDDIQRLLREHGAVVLRGFDVGGVDGFARSVTVLSGDPLPYSERSSPRTSISGNVYTSTEYPATAEIFFHNENSYQSSWPMLLHFHCVRPAETSGATPLSDVREVLRRIDPAVVAEFRRRRYTVVRNFGDYGMSWQEAFGTADRATVERYCAGHGIAHEWIGDGLRTRSVREAVHRHPVTGDEVWFNHVTLFHLSTQPPEIRESLLDLFGTDELPVQTYFGDGGAIPDEVLDHLRSCYRAAASRFTWERDDVIILDNMLVAHGREPYTGPRRIAVAMSRPYTEALR